MRGSWTIAGWAVASGFALLAGFPAAGRAADAPVPPAPAVVLTTISQLHAAVAEQWQTNVAVRLEGVVCDLDGARSLIALRDESGAEWLALDRGVPLPQPGQRVALEAPDCQVTRRPHWLGVGRRPVVDNDGLHGMTEQSGQVTLETGRQPLRLCWFNRSDGFGLNVSFEGPELPRGRIPNTALCRAGLAEFGAAGTANPAPGLSYRCYEGTWNVLPDFASLIPVKTGGVTNFDLSAATRTELVALEFTGFLEVPRAGRYTFWTESDDGSQLFVGPPLPTVRVIGLPGVPSAGVFEPANPRRGLLESAWAQVEGRVRFVARHGHDLEIELPVEGGLAQARILGAGAWPESLLLESRVRVAGVVRRTLALDGGQAAGMLLVAGWRRVEFLSARAEAWTDLPITPVATAFAGDVEAETDSRVRLLTGQVRDAGVGRLVLADASGEMALETALPPPPGATVEVLAGGAPDGSATPPRALLWRSPAGASNQLRLLITAEEVHRLKADEAQREYPVRIRGVVTCDDPELFRGFFLQDATRGIFVGHEGSLGGDRPRFGEIWEIEGVTGPGDFAPVVMARRMTRLGVGRLPEPERPTWDQLNNGSLDAQYIEVQGIATVARGDTLNLLMHGGKVEVRFAGGDPPEVSRLAGALIRIRGTLRATWDKASRQVRVGQVWIGNPSIAVDQPAPADPFSAPLKSFSDLLRFDPQAATFQRVKVSGQVVAARGAEHFLMSGTNGLRFQPAAPVALRVGDLAEVVGFPDLTGPSPALREAVARVTGRAPPPPATEVTPEDLTEAQHDATRVTVEATLVEERTDGSDQVLQMRSGFQGFLARLGESGGRLAGYDQGSELELTGVCVGQGVHPDSGRMESFELLLNSPADVRLLARPPWWTLERLLLMLGALLGVLALAGVWIALLHRQVETRTTQLRREIRERERAEQARLIEVERARIARDLHDDLGSSLTRITLLSQSARSELDQPHRAAADLDAIYGTAREVTRAMDEIVWAVNPRHDTLDSLANYLGRFAQDFLSAADIRCRLDVPLELPAWPLSAEVRHNLFLAFKEVLNNVVKHAGATEVRIGLAVTGAAFAFEIEDNGVGFPPGPGAGPRRPAVDRFAVGNGLANLRKRMEEVGGDCQVESAAGSATRVRLSVPPQPQNH